MKKNQIINYRIKKSFFKLSQFFVFTILTIILNIAIVFSQNANIEQYEEKNRLIKFNKSKYFVKNIGQLNNESTKSIDINPYYLQLPQTILYYSKNHNYDIFIKKSGFVVTYK